LQSVFEALVDVDGTPAIKNNGCRSSTGWEPDRAEDSPRSDALLVVPRNGMNALQDSDTVRVEPWHGKVSHRNLGATD
jgi:hypothetical protein